MKYIFLFFFFIKTAFSAELGGDWYQSCDKDSYHLHVLVNHSGIMEVVSNQIYVKVNFLSVDNSIDFIYLEPEDLGRGGMMYDWDVYSKEKPIANIKQANKNELIFKWNGFFNEKKKKYELVNEFIDSKEKFTQTIKMYRCK
jgi:hypothetical protein